MAANIQIEAGPDGLHVRCEYTGEISSIPAAIERMKAAGILELVQSSRPAAAQAQKPRQARVQPEYDGNGDPCCPKHHKPLQEGKWGLFCSAKDADTERGYCALKFAE